MTWMYGEDWEYAESRLAETLVTHNGRPFFVCRIMPDLVAYGRDIITDAMVHVPAVELDLTPVKLGYCNYNKKAYYTCRIPARRYKQGLRMDNLYCRGLQGLPARLQYEHLTNTIMGVFPSFEKCLDSVKKLNSMAWHRDWAMDREGTIYHRGTDVVGMLQKDKVVLTPTFEYLKEALAEVT